MTRRKGDLQVTTSLCRLTSMAESDTAAMARMMREKLKARREQQRAEASPQQQQSEPVQPAASTQHRDTLETTRRNSGVRQTYAPPGEHRGLPGVLRLYGTCNSPAVPAKGFFMHHSVTCCRPHTWCDVCVPDTELHNPISRVPAKHSAAMSHMQNDKYMDDFDKAWEQMHRMHIESGSTGPGPFQ